MNQNARSLLILSSDHLRAGSSIALKCLQAAAQTGITSHDYLIFGSKPGIDISSLRSALNVNKVYLASSSNNVERLTRPCVKLLTKLMPNYSLLMGPAGAFTRDLFPRLCQSDMHPLNDIEKILSPTKFQRSFYAGAATGVVELKDTKATKILTIRPSFFEVPNTHSQNEAEVEEMDLNHFWEEKDGEVLSVAEVSKDKPELNSAKVVVSGGRALQTRENFDRLLNPLASVFNAACKTQLINFLFEVGATRAAVDSGMADGELQVGQTGQIVSPDVYIGIGISGAVQHLAGIKESKIIVAINKDSDAPLFDECDYGLVGDLFKVVPLLTDKLTKSEI